MANRKKCLSLGFRFAQSFFPTQSQRLRSQMVFNQVLPLSYLSQYPAFSDHFISRTCAFDSHKRLLSSSPSSVVEEILYTEWSEITQRYIEESNIEISHEFVVYALKKLDKDPKKAFGFFSWARQKKSFQPNYLIYNLLAGILADRRTIKHFWDNMEEMKDKGFYLDEGAFLTISDSFKKAKMLKDVAALKHFHEKMIQECANYDEVKSLVQVILAYDWNDEVGYKLHDLKIPITHDILMRALKKLRHCPMKAYEFFEWAAYCPGYQHCSVAYNMIARMLAQPETVQEYRCVLADMKKKGHVMDYDTYIKISRSLRKFRMAEDVVELYEHMLDSPYPPPAQECILILKSISDNPDMELTYRVVRKFEAAGNTISKAIFDGIHRALTSVGRFDEAEKIMRNMKKAGHVPDNITYSQLAYGLCKAGRLEEACEVLDEMEAKGCDPDVITWTVLIKGLCGASLDMALVSLAKMIEKNVDPDADLVEVLVKGFISQEKIVGAYELVTEMVERADMKPWQNTYKILTEKLLEAGKLEEAYKILRMMKKHGYPPCSDLIARHISKFGTVEEARTFLAAISVKQEPSDSSHILFLKSFLNEGRLSEAKDLLYTFPDRIRQHKEVSRLLRARPSLE